MWKNLLLIVVLMFAAFVFPTSTSADVETTSCTSFGRDWDAVMISGSQQTGVDKVTLQQMWTVISASGRMCGTDKRNTLAIMCISDESRTYFWLYDVTHPVFQAVLNTGIIPIETAVDVECVDYPLHNKVFLPTLYQMQ